jgi:diguanylate cyclase (GGDEF)-like protein
LAQQAVDDYRDWEDDRMLFYSLEFLAKAFSGEGQYQAAYETQLEYIEVRDRYRERMNESLSQRLKIEYDLSQKELQNKELVFQNETQRLALESQARVERWQWVVLVLGLALLLVMANRVYVYFNSSKKMRSLALTDPLTGTANRRAIEAFAEEQFGRAEITKNSVSFIAFDIDFFKRINDTYGHDQGDRAIVHIAKCAKGCLRSNDMLARYGGEEFLVLLPGAGLEQAVEIAERICKKIAETPLDIQRETTFITVSLGVASKKEEEKSPGMTIRRADTALYEAKNSGRDRVAVSR